VKSSESSAPKTAAVFVDVKALTPWAKNPRKNDPAVKAVADSIKRFGFGAPLLARQANGEIIAGHTRLKAAIKLGLTEVPVRYLDLDESEAHALALADNKVGELAEWDDAVLTEVIKSMADAGENLEGLGWSSADVEAIIKSSGTDSPSDGEQQYTRKIKAPVYEIRGERPAVSALFNDSKTSKLVAEIDAAGLPADVASFLRHAAQRHTVFEFRHIAEFYAHADEKTQDLMERSALVIIDFDKAVENGFVKMTDKLIALAGDQDASDEE
jgi:hypothetical protein